VDESPPVESRSKVGRESGDGVLGKKSPGAEAKCEISVKFLTFSCRKFRI